MSKAPTFTFMPLGGVGEIGMNLALYGYGSGRNRRFIMVDCGVSFAGPDLPGIDLITPDISYIEKRRDKLDGIIITHAHEDHIGALLTLWPHLQAPVYISNFAQALLEAKNPSDQVLKAIPFERFNARAPFTIGDFTITAVPVSHSIPESHSLLIEAGERRVVHTGDWKLDAEPIIGEPTSLADFKAFADAGPIDAVMGDSTNAMRDGESPTEAEVGKALAKVIKEAEQRVCVTLFSSNMARIKSILDGARDAGRTVVLAGRALQRVIGVGVDLGILTNLPPIEDMRRFDRIARSKTLVLLTGSQGEERAALSRTAEHDHPHLSLTRGDTVVFSSRIIPGNERGVLRIMNKLAATGIKIITDADAPIHVSGHPRRGELVHLYSALKPTTIVPVHGEARHMNAHAKLAKEHGYGAVIVNDGDILEIRADGADIIDGIESSFYVKDGNLLTLPGDSGVYERRTLAEVGVITIALGLSGAGKLVSDIEVIVDGLPDQLDDEDADSFVLTATSQALRALPMARRRDVDSVSESLRKSVRGKVREAWGKRPVVHVHALLIDKDAT
ncbi:MAG: ribonuclease J [Hyphomicrobiales bacterium]|jgi:ribonuclease J